MRAFIFLILIVLLCPVRALAYTRPGAVVTSLSPVRGKIQKHFDVNQDKVLNIFERSLYDMHKRFHFPLAKGKKMLFFDQNKNLMLEASEYTLYLREKRAKFKNYRISVAHDKARMKNYQK